MRLPAVRCLAVLYWCAAALARPAAGETVTLAPAKDNTLFGASGGNLSDGRGPRLYLGRDQETGDPRRFLIKFELATIIPAGAIVDAVTLELTLTDSPIQVGPQSIAVEAHRLLEDWGEGTSNSGLFGGEGAVASTGDATWSYSFYDTTRWGTPGGTFSSTVSASKAVPWSNGVPKDYQWIGAGLTGDVQAWVNQPATNFGWIFLGDESNTYTGRDFGSVQASASLQPQLIVSFTAPEPSATALLLTAAACLGRARWRKSAHERI